MACLGAIVSVYHFRFFALQWRQVSEQAPSRLVSVASFFGWLVAPVAYSTSRPELGPLESTLSETSKTTFAFELSCCERATRRKFICINFHTRRQDPPFCRRPTHTERKVAKCVRCVRLFAAERTRGAGLIRSGWAAEPWRVASRSWRCARVLGP